MEGQKLENPKGTVRNLIGEQREYGELQAGILLISGRGRNRAVKSHRQRRSHICLTFKAANYGSNILGTGMTLYSQASLSMETLVSSVISELLVNY